ncbi:MAG: two-component sensor histidine kinase [Paenibacillus sp.]|nr:two-component sensor histidine kinase [Paenibacillus sp.]
MRSLYVRIVVTFVLISLVSGLMALFLTNLYYVEKLKGYNESHIMDIAEEIRTLYEKTPSLDLGEYLAHIGNMGFQIYSVDDQQNGKFYGVPFKHQHINNEQIERVLLGEIYNGLSEDRNLLMITSLFESSIMNSIGIPVISQGNHYAVFIRPNMEQQIGVVRIVLGLLLGASFLLNILFIFISTRYIVMPVKKLTEATNRIVRGDYNIKMDVARRDELGNLALHFAQMARSLKQLDEMRQEFVANVSHEIQTPLTSIQGFSQAILERSVTPDEELRYLHIIEEESRRLSSLSKQLLTLATLDKEEHILKPTSYRLDEQIRQVLIVTEWQWSDKQLRVEPDLPEIVITADYGLLHQVWLNLISNSIKFSRKGDTIRIGIQINNELEVEITDTGLGISEAELPYIFDRFYKADKARNRKLSGSGLGLSIVTKIVDMHQGSVDVQSQLGVGTTFIVKLPRL